MLGSVARGDRDLLVPRFLTVVLELFEEVPELVVEPGANGIVLPRAALVAVRGDVLEFTRAPTHGIPLLAAFIRKTHVSLTIRALPIRHVAGIGAAVGLDERVAAFPAHGRSAHSVLHPADAEIRNGLRSVLTSQDGSRRKSPDGTEDIRPLASQRIAEDGSVAEAGGEDARGVDAEPRFGCIDHGVDERQIVLRSPSAVDRGRSDIDRAFLRIQALDAVIGIKDVAADIDGGRVGADIVHPEDQAIGLVVVVVVGNSDRVFPVPTAHHDGLRATRERGHLAAAGALHRLVAWEQTTAPSARPAFAVGPALAAGAGTTRRRRATRPALATGCDSAAATGRGASTRCWLAAGALRAAGCGLTAGVHPAAGRNLAASAAPAARRGACSSDATAEAAGLAHRASGGGGGSARPRSRR